MTWFSDKSLKMEYKAYLNSKSWIETRIDILTNRPRCERCGSKKRLQVHHLSYDRIGNEDPKDLEVLCSKCHMNEHGLLVKNKKVKKQISLKEKVNRKKRMALNKKTKKDRIFKKKTNG